MYKQLKKCALHDFSCQTCDVYGENLAQKIKFEFDEKYQNWLIVA